VGIFSANQINRVVGGVLSNGMGQLMEMLTGGSEESNEPTAEEMREKAQSCMERQLELI